MIESRYILRCNVIAHVIEKARLRLRQWLNLSGVPKGPGRLSLPLTSGPCAGSKHREDRRSDHRHSASTAARCGCRTALPTSPRPTFLAKRQLRLGANQQFAVRSVACSRRRMSSSDTPYPASAAGSALMSRNVIRPALIASTSRRFCRLIPASQTGQWVLYQTVSRGLDMCFETRAEVLRRLFGKCVGPATFPDQPGRDEPSFRARAAFLLMISGSGAVKRRLTVDIRARQLARICSRATPQPSEAMISR